MNFNELSTRDLVRFLLRDFEKLRSDHEKLRSDFERLTRDGIDINLNEYQDQSVLRIAENLILKTKLAQISEIIEGLQLND